MSNYSLYIIGFTFPVNEQECKQTFMWRKKKNGMPHNFLGQVLPIFYKKGKKGISLTFWTRNCKTSNNEKNAPQLVFKLASPSFSQTFTVLYWLHLDLHNLKSLLTFFSCQGNMQTKPLTHKRHSHIFSAGKFPGISTSEAMRLLQGKPPSLSWCKFTPS